MLALVVALEADVGMALELTPVLACELVLEKVFCSPCRCTLLISLFEGSPS